MTINRIVCLWRWRHKPAGCGWPGQREALELPAAPEGKLLCCASLAGQGVDEVRWWWYKERPRRLGKENHRWVQTVRVGTGESGT